LTAPGSRRIRRDRQQVGRSAGGQGEVSGGCPGGQQAVDTGGPGCPGELVGPHTRGHAARGQPCSPETAPPTGHPAHSASSTQHTQSEHQPEPAHCPPRPRPRPLRPLPTPTAPTAAPTPTTHHAARRPCKAGAEAGGGRRGAEAARPPGASMVGGRRQLRAPCSSRAGELALQGAGRVCACMCVCVFSRVCGGSVGGVCTRVLMYRTDTLFR